MPQVILFLAKWAKESLAARDLLYQLNQTFELVDIETEEGNVKSKTFSVSRLPTLLFLDNGKEVRHRIVGYNPQEIISSLQTSLETEPISLEERLRSLINSHSLMLFIKGTSSEPRCGFTSQLLGLFKQHGITDFGYFNILSDDQVRQGLKEFSQWPTYPQIYVRGELLGGLDILKEMIADSSFQVLRQIMGNGIKYDPAIEQWNYMRNTTHTYYRFNVRKVIPTVLTIIVIPGLMFYGMMKGNEYGDERMSRKKRPERVFQQ